MLLLILHIKAGKDAPCGRGVVWPACAKLRLESAKRLTINKETTKTRHERDETKLIA